MSLEYPEYPNKYPDYGESMLARIGYNIWHINGISCKHLYNIIMYIKFNSYIFN